MRRNASAVVITIMLMGLFAETVVSPITAQAAGQLDRTVLPIQEPKLESTGLVYELVLVLNRNAIKAKDGKYGQIPDDAEPFYELDARSHHGYKPEGEEGIGGATANTAGALGWPVALECGAFDGTYAAIVPMGYGAMIAGIFRLRFRVANPKNAGVKGAWARIHQGNREAFDLVQSIRAANKLEPLPPPKSYKTKALE